MIGLLNQYQLFAEIGGDSLSFDSVIQMSHSNTGKALSNPIEEGSFASYNKVQDPTKTQVTLAVQGLPSTQDAILQKLDEWQSEAIKITFTTPAASYDSRTLEGYDYSRTVTNGANMLIIQLRLVEVREVSTQVSTNVITPQQAKNPTSASKQDVGKAQTETVGPSSSVLNDIFGGG